MTDTLLRTSSLTKRFGGLVAVDSVDLEVKAGEIRGLIGPNGAGKTTLFSLLSGALRPSGGRAFFSGTEITRARTHQIVDLGLVRTFQRSAVFHGFSVFENVLLASFRHARETPLGILFGNRGRTHQECRERVHQILQFVGLSSHENEPSEVLPLGHQRSLGLAIALATRPTLVMLDEPAAGMNNAESAGLADLITRMRTELGTTVLLVEHDMKTVMDVCDTISVIDFGRIIAEGTPDRIANDERVIEAYLGKENWEEELRG